MSVRTDGQARAAADAPAGAHGPTPAPTVALVPYAPADAAGRAWAWSALDLGERRRRAVAAASTRDEAALVSLLTGYVLTRGRARAAVSPHTLESYTCAVRSLLAHWPEEALLHPGPDAGDRYLAALSRAGYTGRDGKARPYRPASLAARLAGAKALYRALRWARATTADPFGDVRAGRDPTPRHERRLPYSEAELARLLDWAGRAERVLILLCAHAGLRIAEALALDWRDVDLAADTLRVVAVSTPG